jgi:chromosome segregation ATPase
VFQSIFLFALGFLSAVLIGLLIAPGIWRRAVALTRRRLEAAMPLSLNEIEAEKDSIRAEHAAAMRRMEIRLDELKQKNAVHLVAIEQERERVRALERSLADQREAAEALDARRGELEAELVRRGEQIAGMDARLREMEDRLEARTAELQGMSNLYEETSLLASNRQIELAAREGEIERLSAEAGQLRKQRNDLEKRLRETTLEGRAANEVLRIEQHKVARLEARLERMLAELSEREEKLERREKELERIRQQHRLVAAEGDIAARLAEEQAQRLQLEVRLAELEEGQGRVQAMPVPGNENQAGDAEETARRDRLEQRLSALNRENKRLREQLARLEAAATQEDGGRGEALLREQIQELAAEVVRLAMTLEGPDSPIRAALQAEREVAPEQSKVRSPSLAQRIRRLQRAASPS